MAETRFIHRIKVDLNDGLKRRYVGDILASGDEKANRFEVTVCRGSENVDLAGCTVTGYFIRPNDETMKVDGAAEGSSAVVEPDEHCYVYDGGFSLAIKVIGKGIRQTVAVFDGRIVRTSSDKIIDGNRVYYGLEELLEQIEATENAAISANNAADSANAAASNANTAADAANLQAGRANSAANSATGATAYANGAARDAIDAADAANSAAQSATDTTNEIRNAVENGDFNGVGIASVTVTRSPDEYGFHYIEITLTDGQKQAIPYKDGENVTAEGVTNVLGYAVPEMFGAIGDGTTDDADAFQAAINTGKPVLILPGKKYALYKPLEVDGVDTVSIYGANTTNNYQYNNANITCYGHFLHSETGKQMNVTLHGFSVYYAGAGYGVKSNASFIDNISLSCGGMKYCVAVNFGHIIRGAMHDLVKIDKCSFVAITKFFLKQADGHVTSDSQITNTYISGAASANPNFTDTTNFTFMFLSGNYIDFFKTIFTKSAAISGTTIAHNVFDSIWRLGCVDGDVSYYAGNGMTSYSFVGNTFKNFSDALSKKFFTNPDADMVDGNGELLPSCVFYMRDKIALYGATIIGNCCMECDRFIDVSGYNINHVKVIGNSIGNATVNFSNWSPDKLPDNIYIDVLEKREVDALPDVTGGSWKNVYCGITLYKEHKAYRLCSDKQWRDFTGALA